MTTKELVILIAEDDAGHAALIQKNLRRAGVSNQFIHFKDGREALDFLFRRTQEPRMVSGTPYMMLLDINMPGVDGVEVLRQVKADKELKKIPVVMLTTTDDPREVERCHMLGASNYISKPVEYERFAEAIQKLGLFIAVVSVPGVDGETRHVAG
jgi:CheY-like chemotaxis protein